MQDFLGDLSGNATGTSWGWDESDVGGTALTLDLNWDGMDGTDLGSPVTSSDWDDVALGVHESTLDGNLDLLSDLDTNTDVSLSVSASNNSLESSSLSGLGLLLDGEDAHDLVREFVLLSFDELINDLGFLDWDGESVDFFEGFDLTSLDESSELGEWGPLVLSETSSATSTATGTSSAASAASSSSVSTTSSETSFWSISS